ncbi:MAG: mechanosensitive ion channel family protein [Spirochaetaceae bacterium]|jgi:small-conductance mechanosensitive channel|nr:mechanosensitive ion channel family protein [Spirochaetaceae bacterium]
MFELPSLDKEIISVGLQYGLLIRVGIAVGILVVQVIVIKLLWKLFGAFSKKIAVFVQNKIKPFKIKNVQLLDKNHLRTFFNFLLWLIKWIVTIALLVFTIPIILSLFEPTRGLATTLFGYILSPLKNFFIAVLKYIPNMISIVVIILISRYSLRLLKFFARQITTERLKLHGFYPDWANTTFNILRILVYAFTVAMVFPLLPGSDSQAFQGISLLVGLLFSLGSSSAIGNVVAGIVITYMRPFKVGDRIKINDITGFVVEKAPMTTRIRTHKNEFVTFPNLTVLNASVTNYNSSTEQGQPGLILHADVTFGYDTPCETIERLLLTAADKTEHLEKSPKPFMQIKSLNDFYCVYEINAYTKAVQSMMTIYSDLYRNIQAEFDAEGLDLTAPYYYNIVNQEKKPVNGEGEKNGH